MDRARIEAAFQRVADENGVTLETVLLEIEGIIRAGVHSGDAQIRNRWKLIPCAGEVQTAFELAEYVLDQLQEKGLF